MVMNFKVDKNMKFLFRGINSLIFIGDLLISDNFFNV